MQYQIKGDLLIVTIHDHELTHQLESLLQENNLQLHQIKIWFFSFSI